MRRITAFIVAIAALAALDTGSAQAKSVTMNVLDFVTLCQQMNGLQSETSIRVTQDGEGAQFFSTCQVFLLGKGLKLSFVDVTLTSASNDFNIGGGQGAQVSFTRSTVSTGGNMLILPGDELGSGKITLKESHLTAHQLDLKPSCPADKGNASIKNSTLTAETTLTIAASHQAKCGQPATGGKVSVTGSTLSVPDGSLSITTGEGGSTKVTGNTLSFTTVAIAGAKCTTKDNSPPVACP